VVDPGCGAPGTSSLYAPPANGPTFGLGTCQFSFAADGEFVTVPAAFTATKGVWIGARAGLFATSPAADGTGGHADFDYFRFTSP